MGIEKLLLFSVFFEDTTDLPMYGDGEKFKKKELYNPPKIEPSSNLTIRDFPASGFQLHIHEGNINEPSSLVNYPRTNKFLLSSYDAAMADGGKPAYDAIESLERINKICGIKDDD
jgi:hypothetical protein